MAIENLQMNKSNCSKCTHFEVCKFKEQAIQDINLLKDLQLNILKLSNITCPHYMECTPCEKTNNIIRPFGINLCNQEFVSDYK